MNPVYLSICVIVRNEAPYIGEWIEFHRLVGVERFYIYDDGSTDRTCDVISRHDRGDIVLAAWEHNQTHVCPVHCPFGATHQTIAFNRFLAEHRAETQWTAFIDPDEYLYHRDCDDVRDPLYEEIEARRASAIFVNWLIFGSSGHARPPSGLTIANYTRRGMIGEPPPFGRHGKLIARMGAIEHFGLHGSHNATFREGFAINEHGKVVPGPTNPDPTTDRWRLNHYYHRSTEEALKRVLAVDNNTIKGHRKTRRRMRAHDLNTLEDRDILRFLPRLMEAMNYEVHAIPGV